MSTRKEPQREYPTFSEAWWNEIHLTRSFGDERMPRGLETRDRRWVQFAVIDPMTFPVAADGRKFADVIGVLEGLSLVGQTSIPETFTDRVRAFGRFTDHGVFHGAYGIRAYGHLGDLVSRLNSDLDTRQAVLSIYDSDQDLGVEKKDVPCTLTLQFQAVDETSLELRVTMRSNDLWLGTPYDFQQFAILQASVAQALGLVPGMYVHSVGSLHLYRDNLDPLMKIDEPINSRMAFPLWGGNSGMASISRRARELLLWPDAFEVETEFESYAKLLLLER